VLGSPIAHSLSPALHNAAFAAQGLEYEYTRFELANRLAEFLETEGSKFDGFSVTMPMKDQAYQSSAELSELATRSRSVNTLVKSGAGWGGFNTDVLGFQGVLSELEFDSVSVIGTGATARSAITALDGEAQVWGRSLEKTKRLCEEYGSDPSSLSRALQADLVISTLPADALDPLLEEERFAGVLFDVVYQGWPTAASRKFAGAVSGKSLLLHQAIFQQRLFVNGDVEAPLESELDVLTAMREALEMAE